MSINSHIEKHLNQHISSKQLVGTGLFEAYQVTLGNNQKVFIKVQNQHNQQLIDEGKALILLGNTIHTPKVLGSCEQCLILQWIQPANNPNYQAEIGFALARLHQNTQPYFGFHSDNTIGQTPQPNAVNQRLSNWAAFYWQYRLLHQIELAKKNKRLSAGEYQQLLRVECLLPGLLDDNIKPSLLHGDLWSGNVLSGKHHPTFIDPACYYGHREIDFALTFMFGGFSSDFYNSYETVYPLESDFEKRKPLYMLYHYLNHLNIFGVAYHASVLACTTQLHLSCVNKPVYKNKNKTLK